MILFRLPYKYLWAYTAVLVFCSLTLNAQINIPDSINIELNGENWSISGQWQDSLAFEAEHFKTKYRIVAARSFDRRIITKLQIPQVLNQSELIRQIVLYYALIESEYDREREKVAVYPYFTDILTLPGVTGRYSSPGQFEIKIEDWPQVSLPAPPSLHERDLYNQLLKETFGDQSRLSGIPDSAFERVALKNNVSIEYLTEVYQMVLLWQLSQ